jgi:hypothetical protein
MIEVLPVGARVSCACPRALFVADTLRDHIRRCEDGRPRFPAPAPFLGLRVWHEAECPAAPIEHEHWNVSCDGWIFRCSICGLERTNVELADEIRARSRARAAP